MSAPYVYTAPPLNYYNSPYLGPITNAPNHTPIIPSLSLGGSPFIPPSSLPGHSPYASGPPNSVAFPPTSPYYGGGESLGANSVPADQWVYERRRRPSWHGGVVGGGTLYSAPPLPPQTNPFYLPMPPAHGHQRTRSFGAADAAAIHYWAAHGNYTPSNPIPIANPYTPTYIPGPLPFPTTPQTHIQIHPFLNGEHPRPDFIFDLSAPDFSPMILLSNGQTRLLSLEELGTPATYPPITYMRVECDLLPHWPIDVAYNAQYSSTPLANPPPLTLGAVLSVIYYSLHVSITQDLWATLDDKAVYEVSKAYTKRCRAMGSREMLVRNQGVKRVDFLLDRTDFRGFVRAGQGAGGLERVKLIVG